MQVMMNKDTLPSESLDSLLEEKKKLLNEKAEAGNIMERVSINRAISKLDKKIRKYDLSLK